MERVMIFIDGSNLYKGMVENLGISRVNLEKFVNLLCGQKRRLICTYYYNVPLIQQFNPESYRAQQRFFNKLRLISRFEVKLGRLVKREKIYQCPKCHTIIPIPKCPKCKAKLSTFTFTEKGVDVSIATDMLANAFDNTYDTAILVSGDGDFVPVVEEIKRLHKSVENAYFIKKPPTYLSTRCIFTPLTSKFLKPCTLPSKKSK